MKRNNCIMLVVIGILLLIPIITNAQEDPELIDLSLEELMDIEVVTASQTSQKITDAPATIYVITESQIKDRGYSSLEELLEDIPEIEIQHKSVAEFSNYYSLRGIAGNEKFMILLDGIRINSMAGTPHAVTYNYSVANAKRVEVILGPASALYGVDAFSGIINIITRTGEELNGGEVNLSYGSFNTTNNSVVVGYGNENISFSLTGSTYYSDEPYFPDLYKEDFSWYNNSYKVDGSMRLAPFAPDVIVPTGAPLEYKTPTMSYFMHTGLKIKDFEFGYTRNYESHNSSMGMRPDYNIYTEDAQYNTIIGSFYAKHTFSSSNEKWNIQTNLSRGSYELTPTSHFRNTFTSYNSGYKYAQHNSFQLREQVSYNIAEGHSVIAGFSFQDISALAKSGDLPFAYDKNTPEALQGIYYIGTNTTDNSGNDMTIYQDFYHVQQINYGSFLQYQGKLTSFLNLTAGLRYDYNTRYDYSINPRIGAVISATDNLKFKLLYGEAFLAPSVYKAFQHYGAFVQDNTQPSGLYGPFWHLTNPDLEPEKLKTIEFGSSYIRDKIGVTMDVYYNLISNLIVPEVELNQTFQGIAVGAVERSINKGEANTYGFTVKLDTYHDLGTLKLKAYLAYSYSDGEIDDMPLSFSAQSTVKCGINLRSSKLSINPSIIYRTESLHPTALDANGNPESNDSYALVNLYAKYQITEFLGINLKVRNALDSRYYNVSLAQGEGFAATPQDPMSIIGGINFTF